MAMNRFASVVASMLFATSTAWAQKVSEVTEGEVRRVNKEAQKITIRHAEIKSLDMPAMTMVFQVKDPAMLDQVKTGDRVKFRVENVGGAFVVNEIEVTK